MATIQIADNDARVQYTQAVTANTTQLTIDFPFFDLDDINVIVTTAAGVDTVLSRGTGTGTFAVTGTSVEDGYSGGYVTLGDTYSAGTDTFTIFRDIPITRTTDFPTSGPFNVASLNTELDKLTAIAQQNETSVSRTLQLSDSDTTVDLKLPNLDTRKGTTLAFNATTGVPEAGPTISDVQTVSNASADIATLADIEDGTVATNAISTVAGISSDVTTVSGISANVTTVSGISSDVTAVAADATDIGIVSSNISSVNTVATNISDVIAVANDLNEAISEVETVANDLNEAVSEIDTVAASISNVDTVGTNIANVNTVAGNNANVTTVAGISANVTTVAGISGNVTTVAGISGDVTTVAADATDIGVVATDLAGTDTIGTVAGSISNVNTVGTNISSVNTNATNISSINTNATNITDIQNASANAASALASKNAAATSEANAATSETNAASSASSASTSASTATTQAGIATTKAGEAATSESNAATSATNAASSATSAASSASSASSAQSAAESARDATLAAYDNFDDRYLGAKSSAPTLDNDGNALVAGALYFDTVAEAMYVYTGSSWVAAYVSGTGFLALSGGTMTGDINFGDNDKAVFGAGGDLQLFHDGSKSVIQDAGTGNLVLRGSDFQLKGYTVDENMITATNNGAVYLFYDSAAKLATTATGADITGTLTADGLTVDGGASASTSYFRFAEYLDGFGYNGAYAEYDGSNNELIFGRHNTSDTNTANDIPVMSFQRETGDISFYDSTGTTQGFYWDASTQRLGLGTTGPSSVIDASGSTTNNPLVRIYPSSNDVPDLSTYSGTISADVGLRIENTNASAIYSGISLNTRSLSQSSWNIYNKWTGTAVGDLLFVGRNGGASMVERMRIVGSNGFVGIGESAPEQKLHISGTFLLNNNQEIRFKDSGGSQRTAIAMSSNDLNIGTSAGGNLKFYNGSSYTERMRIDSSGNLLVGKTSANFATAGATLYPSGMTELTRSGDKPLKLNRLSTDGSIIDLAKDTTTVGSIGSYGGVYANIGTGNVGLMFNTSASAVIPHNMTTNAPRGSGIDLGQSGYKWKDGYFIGTVYADQFLGQNDTNTGIAVGGNDVLQLSTGGSEKARVNASGMLLVGKTANGIAIEGHEFGASGYAYHTRSGGTALYLNRLTSDGDILDFRRSGGLVGSVSVTTSGTTYNTTSDIRLKENIEPLVATDKLMAMNPVSYNWKSDPDGPRSMGFIAQEMQEVMPEAVSVGDDEDAMMSMDYGRITPVLVSALQDAHRKIEELAAEIAELKGAK